MKPHETIGRAGPARSLRPEIRNPLLKLRAAEQIRALPPEARQALASLFLDLSRDARERAQQSWSRNKAPMAVYWKVVSVYAGHLHRVMRPTKAEITGLPLTSSPTRGRPSVPEREGA
mgnify:CR=1 FL=1